jgi:hypothetical protein
VESGNVTVGRVHVASEQYRLSVVAGTSEFLRVTHGTVLACVFVNAVGDCGGTSRRVQFFAD